MKDPSEAFIPVNTPALDGNEKKYVIQCLDSGWISSEGPFVAEFERRFAARVGRKYGVAVCNGSVALDLAVLAAGVGAGDEVILPTFTIISCAAAIVRAGAVPVVVDSHADTWNMDVSQIRAKLTSRTKAIMVVHIYGLPVDMDPVLALAAEHGLRVIEDAAEVHGQFYRGRACGSFGDLSTFSFYPNKHITTGEGGMIVTDCLEQAEKCRSYRNLCFQSKKRFIHEELGWNFRLTNIQAALGLAQLESLDRHIERKREIGKLYMQLLGGIHDLGLPVSSDGNSENIYWVFGVVLGDSHPFPADEAMKRLASLGIGTRPFFWPMHEQPVFQRMGILRDAACPVSERLARRGFYLPSGLALTNIEIARVAKMVREVLL